MNEDEIMDKLRKFLEETNKLDIVDCYRIIELLRLEYREEFLGGEETEEEGSSFDEVEQKQMPPPPPPPPPPKPARARRPPKMMEMPKPKPEEEDDDFD